MATPSNTTKPSMAWMPHLAVDGYQQFFDGEAPVSSWEHWKPSQIKQLQMMIVDPQAQAKISDWSVQCPVVYPPKVESLEIYDCFWYIDPDNKDKYPFMYQITDITEGTACASCRRILLSLSTDYEKATEEGEGSGVVIRRNRTYYLGETLRLQLDDIVTYPKLNNFAFEEFKRMGVKIKGEAKEEEEDRSEEEEEEEEEGEEEEGWDEEEGEWESEWEEYTEEELVLEENSEEGEGDASFDSLSGECGKLCVSEWEKENRAWRKANSGPNLKLRKKRVRRKVRVRKKMVDVEGEVEGRFVAVRNDPRIGELKKISSPTSTPQSKIKKAPSKASNKKTGKKNATNTTPFQSPAPVKKEEKEIYDNLTTPTSPKDTSPNTVCITFIQSRHTKIEYHEGYNSEEEEDDGEIWGDFKGADGGSNGIIGGSAFSTTEYMVGKNDGF